jgi:hypothetical protein
MGAMTNNKRLRKLFVWSAIFAVLVASLVPPVTRAVYRQTIPTAQWLEVCTVEGLQHLPAALFEDDPDSQASNNSDSHPNEHFEHCSFCVTQACSFGLTPVDAALLPLMAARAHDPPPHALPAPHIEFGWQPNQARAPPVFL